MTAEQENLASSMNLNSQAEERSSGRDGKVRGLSGQNEQGWTTDDGTRSNFGEDEFGFRLENDLRGSGLLMPT